MVDMPVVLRGESTEAGMADMPVVLRSESPDLIEAVRAVLAVAGLPVAIYPEAGRPPGGAGLVLDGGEEVLAAWRHAGNRYARVSLHAQGDGTLVLPHSADRLLSLARAANRNVRAQVIGVVGACGGVGASVLAAAFARVSASAALAVTLVDGADGSPLDVLLGIDGEAGMRWPDLIGSGSVDPVDLVGSLPIWSGVRVLCTDRRPAGMGAHAEGVILALAQSQDVVVIDLPRHAVAAGLAGRWCDTVLVATTSDVASASAARTLAATLTELDARLVVRGPTRGGLSVAEVVELCGLPLAGAMRPERSLPGALAHGMSPGDSPRGPLMRLSRSLVADLGVAD